MARILIADDDESVRRLVSRSLEKKGHAVQVARHGREAVDLLHNTRPDLVILDIVMPHITGIQVCRYLRSNPQLASIPILFLTVRADIEDKVVGYEAGGDDYLCKPFALQELELRVDVLLRSSSRRTPTGVLVAGPIEIDPVAHRVLIREEPVSLTPVEFELLYYLVSRADQVVGTEQLLQQVWGYPPGSGHPSLVRMHILNLRHKIEVDASSPVFVCTVPRHGYMLNTRPEPRRNTHRHSDSA